jgi:hypothetical protein
VATPPVPGRAIRDNAGDLLSSGLTGDLSARGMGLGNSRPKQPLVLCQVGCIRVLVHFAVTRS